MAQTNLFKMNKFACSEGLFEASLLKHITPTVCEQSDIEVIDFDKTKKIVSNKLGFPNQPKSCDALKIVYDRVQVVFIEMKSFQMFKKWILEKELRDDHSRSITNQIEKFNIPQKFLDSRMIFEKVWEWSASEGLQEIKFTNVILTDIPLRDEKNSEELIDFTILYLADDSISSDVLIQAQMYRYLENNFNLDDKPLLLDCKQLEIYLCA